MLQTIFPAAVLDELLQKLLEVIHLQPLFHWWREVAGAYEPLLGAAYSHVVLPNYRRQHGFAVTLY